MWIDLCKDICHKMGIFRTRVVGRHVTRSFVAIPLSRSDGSKNPHFAFFFYVISPIHHSQFKFQKNFDDELRCPTAISPLQAGP
jgi:hypothetical protein